LGPEEVWGVSALPKFTHQHPHPSSGAYVVAPRVDATSNVSYEIEWPFLIVYFKAQQAFNHLLQAIDISEPKGAWQYYEISQVVARVV